MDDQSIQAHRYYTTNGGFVKYINLPKPHGFLIWRGKQTAIASPVALSADEKMLLVSNDEAYGEVVLSNPIACNLSEFERLESEHRIRPEDRKLYWPDASVFYVHRFKDWQPYEEYIEEKHLDLNGRECQTKRVLPKTPIRLNGDTAELLDLPEPNEAQKELLLQAERLPKTIILSGAVTLEGTKAIINGVDPAKVQPILNATLSDTDLGDASLDLYQLALVRVPRLLLKKKELEMPYKVVADYDECKDEGKPVGIINTDTDELKGCSADVETAEKAVAAMMANEDKSIKELLAEARKCYDEGMAMPVIVNGPTTFADLSALEEAREVANETYELSYQFQLLSSNILSNSEIADKGAALSALAGEYSRLVQQVGKKEIETDLTEMDKSFLVDDDKAGKRVKTSMKDKLNALWDTFKEFMDWANEADKDELPGFSKGFGIKQVNGIPWFIAYSTNAFIDREGEIFSTKSLEKYVEEAELKADKGHFNFWHIPNTDFAQKEWQAVVGRVLVEAGPFLDNELGQAAYKFFEQYPDGHPEIAPDGWGTSPEYRYLPEERKTGVYENIWISRTSALSRLAAANIWTKGNIKMALTEKQVVSGKTFFGEELFAKIVNGAEEQTKELEEAKVGHKDAAEVVETTEVKTEVELDVDVIADAIIKKLNLSIDMQPVNDAILKLGEQVAELQGTVKSLEKQKALENKVETPRFVFSLQASKAAETIISEDDELKNKKPAEAAQVPTDGSLASLYFPQR